MAYHVHFKDSDKAYLDALPLSSEAKEKIYNFVRYAIAEVGDAFRNDPANRQGPGCFHRDLILWDRWGDGQYHRIDFIVDDQHALQGVLIIVYVEHQ
ncbi:MAG TPA: hypothetical protein VK395_29990 [Gemmataceae bacterium]|nr:hypothetical protein [Gemmataceae bacterium]